MQVLENFSDKFAELIEFTKWDSRTLKRQAKIRNEFTGVFVHVDSKAIKFVTGYNDTSIMFGYPNLLQGDIKDQIIRFDIDSFIGVKEVSCEINDGVFTLIGDKHEALEGSIFDITSDISTPVVLKDEIHDISYYQFGILSARMREVFGVVDDIYRPELRNMVLDVRNSKIAFTGTNAKIIYKRWAALVGGEREDASFAINASLIFAASKLKSHKKDLSQAVFRESILCGKKATTLEINGVFYTYACGNVKTLTCFDLTVTDKVVVADNHYKIHVSHEEIKNLIKDLDTEVKRRDKLKKDLPRYSSSRLLTDNKMLNIEGIPHLVVEVDRDSQSLIFTANSESQTEETIFMKKKVQCRITGVMNEETRIMNMNYNHFKKAIDIIEQDFYFLCVHDSDLCGFMNLFVPEYVSTDGIKIREIQSDFVMFTNFQF